MERRTYRSPPIEEAICEFRLAPGAVTTPAVEPILAYPSGDVFIPNPDEVRAQLDEYRELATLVPAICDATRLEFGPEAELSLEVYHDPEIDDRYLTLYVRQQKYDADIICRIEGVSDRFQDQLTAVAGHLLLTTDFRPPRGKNAV